MHRKHPHGEVQGPLLIPYLCEGKRMGHMADQDLPQLPVEVSALDPVQVCIYPVDPAKREGGMWLSKGQPASSALPTRGSLFLKATICWERSLTGMANSG